MSDILTLLDTARPLPAPGQDALWTAIENTIAARLKTHWTPPPEMPMEDWLRANLRITPNQSADSANQPLDLRKNPQSRIVAEFFDDPIAQELNIQKSSAGGVSTTVIACLCRELQRNPGNVLYLIGSQPEAAKVSQIYFKPFLRQIFGPVIDEKHQAMLHLKVAGIEIFIGSPTEEQLRNKQIKYLIEDESDTMEEVLKGGAQNLDIAESERTKNARGSKIIRLCCPLYAFDPQAPKDVTQPFSRINRHYLRGDRREFRVPCPYCAIETPIERTAFHYLQCRDLTGVYDLDRVREETVWRCPSCQGEVRDTVAAKMALFERGRHVPTTKALSKTIWSAQVTDLAVLFGKAASWGFVEAALLEAESESESKFAAAKRSHLGEPQAREKDNLSRTAESILRHQGTHERGICPIIPTLVTLCADVQKNATYFPWLLSALNHHGDIFVIDWGEAADTDELEEIRRRPITSALSAASLSRFTDGIAPPVYVTHALIDSGHRAKGDQLDLTMMAVYTFCSDAGLMRVPGGMRWRWVPVKGRGAGQMQTNDIIKESKAKVNDTLTLPLTLYNDPALKSELYHIQLAADPTPDAPDSEAQRRAKALPRIILPIRHPDETLEDGAISYNQLIAELQSERFGTIMKPSRWGPPEEIRTWYVPKGQQNNLGDCLKMTKVAWYAQKVAA